MKVDPLAHGPTHLTILPTYRCTAACAQCCFESNPHVQGRIPIERILDYIDQAAGDFPSLRLVVFSGGECFLLRQDLDAAIERATSRGLATRCVTNGYWATSPRAARERILPLYEAGLTELNFSTGDDHQKFVPFERIVHGAVAAAESGIRALIVVEGRPVHDGAGPRRPGPRRIHAHEPGPLLTRPAQQHLDPLPGRRGDRAAGGDLSHARAAGPIPGL